MEPAALPTVSVIVPVYNGSEALRRTTPAVLAMEGVLECVYVDDGSTDDTALMLRDAAAVDDRVRVATHERNRSRAAARNTGVGVARGEVLFFLDADMSPAPGAAIAHARRYHDPTVLGVLSRPVLVDLDPADPYHRYLREGRLALAAHRSDAPLAPFAFTIGYTSVRADALSRAGGFDESIPYGEDLDLGYRLEQLQPGCLRFAEDAPVYHGHHGTLNERLAKLHRTGRHALPRLFARSPGFARAIGWGFVDSADRTASARAKRALLRPWADRLAAVLLPLAPRRCQHALIRFRSAFALLSGYQNRTAP